MHMQNNWIIFLSICIAVCKSYGFLIVLHLKNISAFIQRFSCAVWSRCDVKGTETQKTRTEKCKACRLSETKVSKLAQIKNAHIHKDILRKIAE